MSIEKKFKSYLAAYDGTPRDFATMESRFEEMSHPDFVLHQSDGSTVTREQMKQTHANLFEAGTKVDLLYFKQNPSTIEFKFRMTNGQCDFTIHNIATLQDGKIIKEEPADTSKPQMWINFESYLAAFDGTPKSFSEVEHLFDALYHDDFESNTLDKVQCKEEVKQHHELFLRLGSKATLLLFKGVGPDTVEFKARMENDELNVVVHNVAVVKDNKFITYKPVDKESLESVKKIRNVCDKYNTEMSCGGTKTTALGSHAEDVAVSSPQ